MKKYDIFLFDADGTLFDYDMAEANTLKIMFDNCGFAYTEDIRQKYREINSLYDIAEKIPQAGVWFDGTCRKG